MKRKLGPLPLWQWIIIGAALGIGTVLYRRQHPAAQAAQDVAAAATPTDAQYNPIDPTTGLPISGGISTGPATTDTTTVTDPNQQFSDMLSNFGLLESLLTGLNEINPGPASQTDPAAVQTQTGTKKAKPAKKTKPKAKPKKTTHAGASNPGHHVTAHGNGRKTAGSSAPHNQRQHHNVAAPAHQRHDPTKHPSASHPAGRVTPTTHVTPAAHPPAKTKPTAKRTAGRPAASHPAAAVPRPAIPGHPAYHPPAARPPARRPPARRR